MLGAQAALHIRAVKRTASRVPTPAGWVFSLLLDGLGVEHEQLYASRPR